MVNAKVHPTASPRSAAPRSRVAGGKEPLQVRIPAVAKRRYKAHAAQRGMETNELVVEIWDYYEASHRGSAATKEDAHR